MREASYLAQNEKKWRKIEELLQKNHRFSADEAANLYVELTDDLAFAQTNYPESPTTKYLNGLALDIFRSINRSRKIRGKALIDFWRYEIPKAVAENHRIMGFVFLFFLFFTFIGAVSTHYDESFPRIVLGDAYVDQTLENIANDDPMGIYKSMGRESMFWGITLNNLRVSGLIFASGVFFCLGSFYLLYTNAMMLGCFQYFFIARGLFVDSFLSIWIHGTIEISCIIIAGTAGVVMGKGYLFPATLSRKQAFIKSAGSGIKIFIGILPLIILAGFLESFITRLTDSPAIFRFGIIILSTVFILWYFVFYPIQLKKKKSFEP